MSKPPYQNLADNNVCALFNSSYAVWERRPGKKIEKILPKYAIPH